jgi:hypothetical protein
MNYSIKDCVLLGLIAGLSVSLLLFTVSLFESNSKFGLLYLTTRFTWINSSYLLASILAWYFGNKLQKHILVWRFISILGSFTFTFTLWFYDYIVRNLEPIPAKLFSFYRSPPTFDKTLIASFFAGLGLTLFTSIIMKFIYRQKEKIVSDDLQLVHKN